MPHPPTLKRQVVKQVKYTKVWIWEDEHDILLLLVLAYKVYKVKIRTKSMCCDDNVIIETQNNGTDDVSMDYSTHPTVIQQPITSEVWNKIFIYI